MILDFEGVTATTNTQLFFGALDQYLKSGRWEISFDIKIIQGNSPDFFISFIYEGDTSGDNTAYKLKTDEVTRITYNSIKSFDPSKTWYFRIFTYTGDSNFNYNNLKLALDNFEIRRTDVVDVHVNRDDQPIQLTGGDLDNGGYTITGEENNYSSLGGSGNPSWVAIDKLVDGDYLTEEQAAYLTSENGFNSPYAIMATTQQVYFNALKDLLIDPSYDYIVTFKVYSPTSDAWHFWIAKEDTSQALAKGMPNEEGVKVFTHTLLGDPTYANVGLYSGSNQVLLIGDIHVERRLHVVEETTPNGHPVGMEWNIDSYLQGEIDPSDVFLENGEQLNEVEGFNVDKVFAHIDGSSTADTNTVVFNGSGIFEAQGKYKVSITFYIDKLEDGPLMVNIDNQTFDPIVDAGETGLVTIEYEITGKAINFFSIYSQNQTLAEVYLATIHIELIEII